MVWCVFDNITGQYLDGQAHSAPDHDGGTQVAVQLPAYPDRRTERWDGAAIRAATQGEMDAYDAGIRTAQADSSLATPLNVLLRDLLWNLEARLRLAGIEADAASLPTSAQLAVLNSANAGTKAAYTAALKVLLEAKL